MEDKFFNTTIYNEESRQKAQNLGADYLEYQEGMEILDSDMLEQIKAFRAEYDPANFTEADVRRALRSEKKTLRDFGALLSPAAEALLEEIALAAQKERQKYFGNNVLFFTPLYLANYCENYCVYCGFNCHNKIQRARLSVEQMEQEMQAISATGMQEVLLLTGESRKMSDINYIGEACKLARKYFKVVGLEIYPVNSEEYAYLHECGADFVTIFQETYNSEKYGQLHLAGHKRSFPYRFYGQERALKG
ncbi:MAG: 2-iminoacetate synthase ThiH, partial [Phascolarctobacterium sp.]|nr:2-iminoacetate synthase ThiH [Phascolarctobacterium sp.]